MQRISRQPPHQSYRIEPITIVVKSRLWIKILRQKAVAEDAGERAALRDRAAEGVVGVGACLARLPPVAVETFDALLDSAHRRHRTVADGAVDVNRSVVNATRAARNIKLGSSMNWNHCS